MKSLYVKKEDALNRLQKQLWLLQDARKLISNKKHWCRLAEARDVIGRGVPAISKEAVKWCAIGAIRAVSSFLREADYYPHYNSTEYKARCFMVETIRKSITTLNDSDGHKAVLKAFDKTTKALKRRINDLQNS